MLSSSSSSSSSVICQTTGPKPLPKRFLHIVRSTASSFNWQYPLLSLRSSTCCRRQFLRKMWPIQLAFRFLISCRIFLCSLTLSNTSSFVLYGCETWSSTLREKRRLKVFENGVLRRIFGSKRDEVTGEWENYITRSFMICTAHPKLLGEQIRKDEIGRACGTYGGQDMCILDFGGQTWGKETTWKTSV